MSSTLVDQARFRRRGGGGGRLAGVAAGCGLAAGAAALAAGAAAASAGAVSAAFCSAVACCHRSGLASPAGAEGGRAGLGTIGLPLLLGQALVLYFKQFLQIVQVLLEFLDAGVGIGQCLFLGDQVFALAVAGPGAAPAAAFDSLQPVVRFVGRDRPALQPWPVIRPVALWRAFGGRIGGAGGDLAGQLACGRR